MSTLVLGLAGVAHFFQSSYLLLGLAFGRLHPNLKQFFLPRPATLGLREMQHYYSAK
jgi:hypothetical protein